MTKKLALVTGRLFLGLLTLFAIVWQAFITDHHGVFNALNYLSYFTNLSNIVAACILIISAFYLLRSRKPSRRDDLIRGAAVLYMAVTGAVYAALLSGEDLGVLVPWINVLLHVIMPLAVVADWLYRPPASPVTFRQSSVWLVFPGIFLVYSLIHGALVDWYPYPFLNPDKVDGYSGVALYCLGILGVFCLLAWLVGRAGTWLQRRRR